MLFNSYIFICIFLPLSLIGWFGLNRLGFNRIADAFLVGMSLWFYGYFKISYLLIIVVSILVNYILSLYIEYRDTKASLRGLYVKILKDNDTAGRGSEESYKILSEEESGKTENTVDGYDYENVTQPVHRVLLILGVLINLGILFYFKYFDFFLENLNAVAGTDFALKGILLPLGISFFTFQQLSYIIDRCLGRTEHADLITYAEFVTFFPQLIAGPIVMYSELIPQFKDETLRRPNTDNLARGIRLFILGLAKKVLLADVLAGVVNYAFAIPDNLDSLCVIFTMVMYAFELYFDFSGYCDMACGIGFMFNISLPLNFDSPYKSSTVKELWNRWHMTLSRFFIQYVYIPLGGSRVKNGGSFRPALNVMIVFTLSGLWHGASWTYVVWGVINGLLVVWDNLCIVGVRGVKYKRNCKLYIPAWLGRCFTFCAFLLTLVFFRSSEVTEALHLIGEVVSVNWNGRLFDVLSHLEAPEFYVLEEGVRIVSGSGAVLRILGGESAALVALGASASDRALSILHLVLALGMILLSFILISGRNAYEIAAGITYERDRNKEQNDRSIISEVVKASDQCIMKEGCRGAGKTEFGFYKNSKLSAILYALLFVWCFVSLSQVSTFLYFNF